MVPSFSLASMSVCWQCGSIIICMYTLIECIMSWGCCGFEVFEPPAATVICMLHMHITYEILHMSRDMIFVTARAWIGCCSVAAFWSFCDFCAAFATFAFYCSIRHSKRWALRTTQNIHIRYIYIYIYIYLFYELGAICRYNIDICYWCH